MISATVTADGSLRDIAETLHADAAAAVQTGIRAATMGMRDEMRSAIRAAFPRSPRLPTAITGKVYPERGNSLRAAGVVKARSEAVDKLLQAHHGMTIRPKGSGLCLAIPTDNVPRGGRAGRFGARMTPDEVQRHFGERLEVVPPRNRGGRSWGALILRRQTIGRSGRVRAATARRAMQGRVAKPLVMFILVPQVDLPKRLDLPSIAAAWQERVGDLIAAAGDNSDLGALGARATGIV